MGSSGKGNFLESIGQGVGNVLGINTPSKLGGGGQFAVSPQAAAAEQEAIARLQSQGNGTGPSITGLQYKQGLDEIFKQQMAAAASARGVSNTGLAQRNAMQLGQQAGVDLTRDSAIARLQEQRTADQAILNQANAQRGIASQAAGAELAGQQQASATRAKFIGDAGAAAGKAFSGGGAAGAAYGTMVEGCSDGGEVDGEEEVPGNSPSNDTKPYMLSPGEIVIPKTAAASRESAMKFLDAIKFDMEGKSKDEESEPDDHKEGMAKLLQKMAELEKKISKKED